MAVHSLAYISTCTGGGGLDAAVSLAVSGARPVLLVEREAFAAGRLVEEMEAGRMAPAPVWSDARTVPGRRFRGCVDLVVGGIPCQPHSLAGRRGGDTDERDLWSPTRRLIVQSGAWAVLIENVPGMLSAPDGQIAGAERVRRDLHRLGFSVEGGLFSAEEVGFPQRRERLFILGVADTPRERSGPRSCEGAALRHGHGAASGGGQLVEPEGIGRGEGLPGAGVQRRGRPAGGAGQPVGNADLARADPHSEGRGPRPATGEPGGSVGEPVGPAPDLHERQGRPGGATAGPGRAGEVDVARASGDRRQDAGHGGDDGRPHGKRETAIAGGSGHHPVEDPGRAQWRPLASAGDDHDRDDAGWAEATGRPGASGPILGLWPPGPDDRDGWRWVLEHDPALIPAIAEPDLRRVADGMAASRIDWLRLLGNGVVPVVGALAFRALAHRLAARGSSGAARLVRMMEAA